MSSTLKPMPTYKRIAGQLAVIVKEQHRPGDMLASENQLSKQFKVTRVTIRKAMDILEDRKLIQRFHSRGAVVIDPVQQGEFAIVVRPALLGPASAPFYRQTAALLCERISSYNNSRWSAKLHLGRQTESGREFPATLDLLDPDVVKRLRGVFTFHPLHELGASLAQNNVPIVNIAATCAANSGIYITIDQDRFYRETAEHLRIAGCKTVGFVWSYYGRHLKPEERRDSIFAGFAIEAGLKVRQEWMPAVIGEATERKAYEMFLSFLEGQNTLPDGIVIDDDVVAAGVLRAIAYKQIRIPDQLRVISYANKGAELPHHNSVTHYAFDISEICDAAIDAMVRLVRGEALKQRQIKVKGSLIKGQTT